MNYFNLLPAETIEFIFNKLNLNDLTNLRIVDKRFKQIFGQIKIKQLILHETFYHGYPLFWFYTNDPVYYKENVIEISKFKGESFKFKVYAKILQLDKHLKRLALFIDDFNFSILNEFKLLEQLKVRTNKLNNNYKLSLDNLKIAHLYLVNSHFKLTFDTIKLFALRLVNVKLNNCVFNYPDKILFFETDHLNNFEFLSVNQLRNLNNLQYLKINDLQYFKTHNFIVGTIDRNILSELKNLKILNFSLKYCNGYDDLIEDIKFLISEKENLRRSEFEIYFEGVKLINQNKINELKLTSDYTEFKYNRLEFQIKNYDLLKDNCDTTEINYCDLIKLTEIIPSSFTNKFPLIHRVRANDHIDNEDQFIKFLNNLQYLSKLELINCELTKSFYDQLIDSVYLKDLKYLTIEEKNDLKINFDFILHLKQLEHLQTNQIIANHIDLIYKLFKGNDLMLSFVSKIDLKNCVEIIKWDNGTFEIRSYYLNYNLEKVSNFSTNSKDLDDVILKLKKLNFKNCNCIRN